MQNYMDCETDLLGRKINSVSKHSHSDRNGDVFRHVYNLEQTEKVMKKVHVERMHHVSCQP